MSVDCRWRPDRDVTADNDVTWIGLLVLLTRSWSSVLCKFGHCEYLSAVENYRI